MLTKSHLILKKTELVIFKHKNKKLECPIKIKLSRKILYPSKSVKYLGLKIDENLNWKVQTHDIETKLNRANALVYKIKSYVSFNTLKAIYFSIFDSKFENKILFGNIIFISKSINNLLPPIFKS